MSLAPGVRIGVYEVTGLLGTGGMGEVYRARDTVLNREVAVKVLPEAVAHDMDRLARFRREAEILAGLNHPNIAQVYGVEPTKAGPALVMEFVSGNTLDQALSGGPLPWQEALVIARQIAAALDAAHERGIVHRDLKPANVKTTDDGVVKVLDFGLAKAVTPDTSEGPSAVANSPTLTARATAVGLILGTAAYMAPEQARGRAVDKRADIWAFGAVLFEMLTATRAFDGDEVSDVLAAVIKTEPAWKSLPADVPEPVRRLLRRCLEKDPRRRLRDVAEGMLQLDEGLGQSAPVAPAAPVRPLWQRIAPVAGGIIIAAGALSAYALLNSSRPDPSTARFSIKPAELELSPNPRPHIAIAPDGTVIYVGRGGLFAKRQTDFDGVRLDGAGAGTTPFVSPDGEWLGFVHGAASDNQLVKVPIGGGPRTPIAVSPQRIYGADWGPDDTIVFGTSAGLFKVATRSETPVPLTTAGTAFRGAHVWPAFAGSTGLVLFTVGQDADARLAAVTLVTGAITELGVSGTSPRYVPTGHIVYATTDGVLRAVPFDAKRIAVTGASVPLERGVRVRAGFGAADFDVSDTGTLVYVSAEDEGRVPVWVDRKGVESSVSIDPGLYTYPRLSHTADRLILANRGRELDLWIWEFARPGLRPFMRNVGASAEALWTLDDKAVLFPFVRNGRPTVSRLNADGSGQPAVVFESDRPVLPHAFAPDGSVIVRYGDDIARLRIDGQPRLETLVVKATNPALSPNGQWLAYESNQSGSREVYLRPFPNIDGGEWQISRGANSGPVWSREGNEIFYIGREEMMSVAIAPGPTFTAQAPRAVFKARAYPMFGLGRHFDVGPGGRFVMLKRIEQSEPVIRVVLNFLEEVAARVKAR